VILDCCHSGSGTRGKNDSESRVRGIELSDDYRIDPAILEKERGTRTEHKFAYAGLSSHVLLAACMPGQTANEIGRRGAFTKSLLFALGTYGASMSYAALIACLTNLPHGCVYLF
jgi:hypothetical protein